MKRIISWPIAGTLEFQYYVDSEPGWDFLRVFIDGAPTAFYESGPSRAGRAVLPVTAGPHEVKFQYSKDASVDRGRDLAWVDNVIALAPGSPGLAEAYSFDDTSSAPLAGWTMGGDFGPWGPMNPEHRKAMRRPVAHSALGYQQTETVSGMQGEFLWPSNGYLRFDYYVSSETNYDFLRVCVDQQKVFEQSGDDRVGREVIQVAAGSHIVKFEYRKDTSEDRYQDTALIDEIELGTRGQVFARWTLDGLQVDSVPWGWTGTGYGGGWKVGSALVGDVVLSKHDPAVLPLVDGVINPEGATKEYSPALNPTRIRLHDNGMREAKPAELYIQSSQNSKTIFLALTFPAVTPGLGDEFGDLRVYLDSANARTRGAGFGGIDGIAPGPEDRFVHISYSIPPGSALGTAYVSTYVGNGARSNLC